MVEISKTPGSYAYVAPPGLNANQKTLNEAADLAGRARPGPTISLGIQARELEQFGGNLANLIQPLGESERNRGFSDVDALSLSQVAAYQTAAARLRQSAAQANGKAAAISPLAGGNNTIANLVASSIDTSGTILGALYSRTRNNATTAIANLLRIQAGYNSQPGADPFSRRLITTYGASGAAKLEVRRVALTASTQAVALDPGSANTDSFDALTLVADGGPTSSSEGFAITANGGAQNDTFVFDTRDPAEADGRLSRITVDTGAGSDVVRISGANYSVVNAGDGNDFVVAEGESIISGGAGDDVLVGNTVSGDEGDDLIYSTSFASGGTGNDTIVLFGLGDPATQEPGIAFGGEGNDTILADIAGAVDGGEGNDTITLRNGGSASGGGGDDLITLQTNGEADGGTGNDDILLLAGGTAIGGEGDDKLTASSYADLTGGKGNDVMSLYGGGIARFARGDGQDRLLLAEPEPVEGAINLPQASKVVFDDMLYSDVTATGSPGFVSVSINGTTDKIDVNLIDQTQPLELTFGKGAQQQVVTFFKGVLTVGPVTAKPTA
jgi:Ca2+-binding RTX toxin-like protein